MIRKVQLDKQRSITPRPILQKPKLLKQNAIDIISEYYIQQNFPKDRSQTDILPRDSHQLPPLIVEQSYSKQQHIRLMQQIEQLKPVANVLDYNYDTVCSQSKNLLEKLLMKQQSKPQANINHLISRLKQKSVNDTKPKDFQRKKTEIIQSPEIRYATIDLVQQNKKNSCVLCNNSFLLKEKIQQYQCDFCDNQMQEQTERDSIAINIKLDTKATISARVNDRNITVKGNELNLRLILPVDIANTQQNSMAENSIQSNTNLKRRQRVKSVFEIHKKIMEEKVPKITQDLKELVFSKEQRLSKRLSSMVTERKPLVINLQKNITPESLRQQKSNIGKYTKIIEKCRVLDSQLEKLLDKHLMHQKLEGNFFQVYVKKYSQLFRDYAFQVLNFSIDFVKPLEKLFKGLFYLIDQALSSQKVQIYQHQDSKEEWLKRETQYFEQKAKLKQLEDNYNHQIKQARKENLSLKTSLDKAKDLIDLYKKELSHTYLAQ